jgi:hypothetical protein
MAVTSPPTMSEGSSSSGATSKTTTEEAIDAIVEMNPRKVTVALTLPISDTDARPTVTLEWTREDTNMPVSELLKQIETYNIRFGAR